MQVQITISDDDGEGPLTMGITAEGLEQPDVFRMLIAGAEMAMYEHVHAELVGNGASVPEATYGAPMRTRLLSIEQLVLQEMQPYNWVRMDAAE